MFARAACEGQLRRGAIHPFREREIMNIDLSGSGAAAKMGRDSMSVVDGDLKVYGIANLRIADASICRA
jgi:choline dehydrogenase-like flavoprotein